MKFRQLYCFINFWKKDFSKDITIHPIYFCQNIELLRFFCVNFSLLNDCERKSNFQITLVELLKY